MSYESASATALHVNVGWTETFVAPFDGDCWFGAAVGQPAVKLLIVESALRLE